MCSVAVLELEKERSGPQRVWDLVVPGVLGDVVGIRAEFCTEKEGSEGFEDRRGRRAQPG